MLNYPGLIKSNGNQNDDGWYIDRKDMRADPTCYLSFNIGKFVFWILLFILKHLYWQKRLKTNQMLHLIPYIVFSSIVSEMNAWLSCPFVLLKTQYEGINSQLKA